MSSRTYPRPVWTLRAQRRLEQILARMRKNPKDGRKQHMNEMKQTLAHSFPGARDVVVQDVDLGFRTRPNDFVLHVEVSGTDAPGRYVVKSGNERSLRNELKAWEQTRPVGLRHDVVLMTLTPRYNRRRLLSLVYQDAQQSIGMDRTTTLEEAVLGAVHHGNPTVSCVVSVISQVYHRLGHLLYRAALCERNAKKFHADSIRTQVDRILRAFQRLGVTIRGPFANPDNLFAVTPPSARGARSDTSRTTIPRTKTSAGKRI